MLSRILGIIAVFSALAMPVGLGSGRVQADGPTVVINELMWMGSSASSADEWIELRNVTDQPVDVSNWTLTKKSSGAEAPMLTIPAGKIISPGGIFLISNYAMTSANSALGVVTDYVTTDVALSNTALQIKLYDAAKTLVDTADDGVGNPLSGAYDSAKKLYAGMERNPAPGDGTQAQNWHPASRGVGFKTNAIELGTPGTQNSNGRPTANAGPDQTGIAGQELNFDGSDSFDPEMQPLTYAWDFGDAAMSVEATPKHVYAAAGEYAVTLTVSDGVDMASDTAKVTIAVAPAAATVPATSATSTAPTTSDPSSSQDGSIAVPAVASSCLGLHLSELYPNPPGVDSGEFIELVNDGDEEVATGACAVFTTATRSYKIPAVKTVARGAWLLLPKSETHLTLNNGGTTVRFVDSDGTELDRATYGAAKEGMSWARFADGWSWTSKPTPGVANVLAKIATDKTNANKSAKNTASVKKKNVTPKKTAKPEPPAERVSLTQVQELDSGDRVIVRGIVTVPRDALGATLAYVQSDVGGVSLAIPNGEKSIQLGQEVEATGTVRLKNGRRYVSVAAHSLRILTSAPAVPTPPTVTTDEVGPDQADQLVHVKGVVSLASGNRIEIDDGSGPVSLYLKSSTGIVRPKVKAGDTVDAVGVVGVSTSGVRVLPRTQSDLRVERVLGATATTPVPTMTTPAASRNQTLWYWVFAALGGLGAGAKPAWVAWRKGHGRSHELY